TVRATSGPLRSCWRKTSTKERPAERPMRNDWHSWTSAFSGNREEKSMGRLPTDIWLGLHPITICAAKKSHRGHGEHGEEIPHRVLRVLCGNFLFAKWQPDFLDWLAVLAGNELDFRAFLQRVVLQTSGAAPAFAAFWTDKLRLIADGQVQRLALQFDREHH